MKSDLNIEKLGPQYYRYTCEKCSKIFYSAAEDEICDCDLLRTPVQKYYALREQAETLWAKRDALIDKIESLAQQAEALEVEARTMYNDPETWKQFAIVSELCDSYKRFANQPKNETNDLRNLAQGK